MDAEYDSVVSHFCALANIFSHLKEMNVSCKVSAHTYWDYEIRLLLLLQSLNSGGKIQSGQRVAVFPTTNKMSETNGINSIIQSEAVDHFNSLTEELLLGNLNLS